MSPSLSERVGRSFTRSFTTYHDAAAQQATIASDLVRRLCESTAPRSFGLALELGCGTGHLTRQLCTHLRFEKLMLNDLSPKAADTAQALSADFLPGDASQIIWPDAPDLIASASMIQWLPEPAAFMRHAAKALAPGGWLAVSGFGPKQFQELAEIGTGARAPGLCPTETLSTAVEDTLEIVSLGAAEHQIHFPTAHKLLTHLRHTGVNGRAEKVWTKAHLRTFCDTYARRFGGPKGLPLTYQPIWIIARKR